MSETGPRILLIEDDPRIRQELLQALPAMGVNVHAEARLDRARVALARGFDLLILDLGLPDGDGLDLCRELRAMGREIPILVLTARDAVDQRVRGLDLGADDYVVKPFQLTELKARIRSVLRRCGRGFHESCIALADLSIDPAARAALAGGKRLSLTPREFELLLFLMRHPHRVWTRQQLLDRVWGPDFDGSMRTVDLHITRLRAAIEQNPRDPRYLETVWGMGYRLREPNR